MMMPANFSAVAENEMTYVVGGNIADYLAPAMGSTQWSNFNKNLITIVGNGYLDAFVANTVGAVFSGNWKPGNGINGFAAQNAKIWYDLTGAGKEGAKAGTIAKGVANIGLNVLGNLAAIYNLGFGTVKNAASESIKITSAAV